MGRSRSRSRDRSRSRSRSRDRRRSRSRERRRRRTGFDVSGEARPMSDAEATQAAIAAIQQEQLQKQLLAQQILLQQQAVTVAGGNSQARRQRELYVGNLNVGIVTDVTLKELFNGALAHLVPDPLNNPPVVSTRIDSTGRFGFVELQNEELAAAGLALDKVDVLGKALIVGRPKGYVDPPSGPITARMGIASLMSKMLIDQPSRVLLLENMLPARVLLDPKEREELKAEVQEEAAKCGTILKVIVPIPPLHVGPEEGGRCYIHFSSLSECRTCKEMFNGRTFDDNVTRAAFVTDEEWQQAQAGIWLPRGTGQGAAVGMRGVLGGGVLGGGALPGPPGLHIA